MFVSHHVPGRPELQPTTMAPTDKKYQPTTKSLECHRVGLPSQLRVAQRPGAHGLSVPRK